MRWVKLPATFARIVDNRHVCYVYPVATDVSPADAMEIYNECTELIGKSDRPSSVVVAFLMNGRIHSTGHAQWIPILNQILKSQHNEMPDGTDRDKLLMEFVRREMICELNVYLSFRPICDFILSFDSGMGDGLDPDVYDWREYVRRGLLD